MSGNDLVEKDARSPEQATETNTNQTLQVSTDSPQKTTHPSSPTKSDSDEPVKSGWKKSFCCCCKMGSDIILIGFILCTVVTYVQNLDNPITRSAGKPVPFFRENSTVRDYWRGDVFKGFKDATYYENSLFMFYAAWDRESQQARRPMEEVAQFFRETDILVAAVNCWYPTSDCAKEFGSKNGAGNDLPVFIFYPNLLNGIQYRGVARTADIIRFVQACRYPLTHLKSVNHLQQLQVEYESILVGYLPATSHYQLDPNHLEFTKTANSLLEAQGEKYTVLAAVTSERLARELHLYATKPVKLFTVNNTFAFPNKTVDAERLVSWSIARSQPTVPWVNLPNKKSLMLKRLLERKTGNALLLLSPRTKLKGDVVQTILRQISVDYLNCDKHDSGKTLAERLKKFSRWQLQQDGCAHKRSSSPWTTASSCQLRSWSSSSSSSADQMFQACSHHLPCSASGNSSMCLDRQRVMTDLIAEDPHVAFAIKEAASELDMRYAVESKEIFTDHLSEHHVDITGLGCNTNNSLSFLRVDTAAEPSLVGNLGLEGRQMPLPVILTIGQENLHLPNKIRSGHFEEDLRAFIADWHSGSLTGKPGFRSTDSNAFIRYKSLAEDNNETSVINELSAETFSQAFKSDKDVLLLYTSSFCSHCTVASHVFHRVKLYMEALPNMRFLVVDGTKNDLDWQFTALSYPSILFVPRGRTDQSRVFGSHQTGLTTSALLGFVVANLRPEDRIFLALNTCRNKCRNKLRLESEKELAQKNREMRRNAARLTVRARKKLTRRIAYLRGVLNVLAKLQNAHPNKMPYLPYAPVMQELAFKSPTPQP